MTSSLVALSFQFTLRIFLHIHISKASSLVFSVFLIVHVSHPYSSTGQTSDFTNLFLKDKSIFLSGIFLFLVYACFAIAIVQWQNSNGDNGLISCSHLPSAVI